MPLLKDISSGDLIKTEEALGKFREDFKPRVITRKDGNYLNGLTQVLAKILGIFDKDNPLSQFITLTPAQRKLVFCEVVKYLQQRLLSDSVWIHFSGTNKFLCIGRGVRGDRTHINFHYVDSNHIEWWRPGMAVFSSYAITENSYNVNVFRCLNSEFHNLVKKDLENGVRNSPTKPILAIVSGFIMTVVGITLLAASVITPPLGAALIAGSLLCGLGIKKYRSDSKQLTTALMAAQLRQKGLDKIAENLTTEQVNTLSSHRSIFNYMLAHPEQVKCDESGDISVRTTNQNQEPVISIISTRGLFSQQTSCVMQSLAIRTQAHIVNPHPSR